MTHAAADTPAHTLASALAEGLVEQLTRAAQRLGTAPQALARLLPLARELMHAVGEGHVARQVHALDAAARAQLLASGLVSDGREPVRTPLVLDAQDRLYLARHHDLERRLARRLLAALPPRGADTADADPSADTDLQALAVSLGLQRRFLVISGGPGTGKTTTVARLLGLLLEREPAQRVALAAPTGKAAARLLQALSEQAGRLAPALRDRLPRESFTVHRLLGAQLHGGFRHHAGHPLAIDTLVVDEASMLDLSLATQLLEAVPAAARIVLLGDGDQLAAVEAGSVFAELSRWPGSGVRLRHNHRFAADAAIGLLATAVREGDAPRALAILAAPAGAQAWAWEDVEPGRARAAVRNACSSGYADYRALCTRPDTTPEALHGALSRFRVLCALREGPRGAAAVNAWLDEGLRRRPGEPWYPGRPVMVLRNDPSLGLFNGDVGITWPDAAAAGRLRVWFVAADASAPGLRAIAPERLPDHTCAWASTVHKAQGSEFETVLVLLPREPHPVTTRELLYTAITRARRQVQLVAAPAVIAAAIGQPTQRVSGLIDRLREAGQAGAR